MIYKKCLEQMFRKGFRNIDWKEQTDEFGQYGKFRWDKDHTTKPTNGDTDY